MPTAAELQVRVTAQGVQQAQSQLQGLGRTVDQTGQGAQTAATKYSGLTQGIAGLSPVALTTAGAVTAAGLALKSTVDASIAWESALAGVAKTVDGTDAEIAALGDAIRGMSQDIPVAATELAAIAEQAGALGIAKEDILAFTEVAATIGVTTDVSSEQAATALGQLSNVLGLTADEYERFASTLVDLGNKGASTESQILSIASRAGAAGELIGLATDETLAWSSAVANLGIEVEAGGSSIQRFFLGMMEHVSAAGEELAIIAETAGTTAGAFQQAFAEDANAALVTFIEGLGRLTEAERLAVLEALGFNDVRITRALLGLAGNTDNLTDSLTNAESAWRENTAAAAEAEKRYATTESQIQLLRNSVTELQVSLGTQLLPAINDVVSGARTLTEVLGEQREAQMTLIGVMPGLIGWMDQYIDRAERATGVSIDWGTALKDGTLNVASAMVPLVAIGRGVEQLAGHFDESERETKEATAAGLEYIRVLERIRGLFGLPGRSPVDDMEFIGPVGRQAEDFATQMDRFRAIGQEAARQLRADWETQFAAMGEAVAMVPEAAGEFIDELVVAFRAGQADIGDVWSIIGQMPEDELIPALQDVRTEWLTTVAEMGDAEDVREAQQNLAALDAILGDLGISLGAVKSEIGTFGDVQDVFLQNISITSDNIGEWEGHLSGAERALGILQDQIDAGIPLTEEQAAQYETLTWAVGRYTGGVEDNEQAFVDSQVALAEFIRLQDEVNKGLEDGNITQEEANALLDEAREGLDPYTRMSLENTEAQQDLAEALGDLNTKLTDVLIALGLLDDTSAEADADVNTDAADENLDRMEGRLQTYEGSTYTADLDLSTTNAINAFESFKTYLAQNPATIDLYVNQINAIGLTANNAEGTGPGGGLQRGTLSWVGERGPELAWLPKGTHILPNDESMKFSQIMQWLGMNSAIPGFAEGTGESIGMARPAPGADISGGGFVDLGTAIAQAIALGVQLGLIESGEPTGSEYARAIIDGATAQIDTDGDEVVDAWVVAHERIPELAANMGRDTVMGLLQEYTDLQGELQLAILSGEDTGEIQAQLDAIFALFAAWSGNTVENVEAVWDAITDEQKAAKAEALWEDVLGSLQAPQAPISFDLDALLSGEASSDLNAAFQELWDLQRMALEAGMTDLAASLGEQMAALGVQEEFINGLLGTDFAQQLAEEMQLEQLGEELDSRLDAVLGDDPLGIADSLQSEIDTLQTKIDLGPAMGVPQEIIDGWVAERDALAGEQDQFWADLATAFAQGALDPDVLADLDEAGRMQLESYLMSLFGPSALDQLDQAMEEADYAKALEEGLVKPTAETIGMLGEIFTETPELAVDMVDDLLAAVANGQMPLEQAMGLLAMVPKKDLIPALEGLEETLTADLAQALLSYGPDSPQVQSILASLGLIDQALDDVTGSAGDATTALDNLPGSKNYQAPGDQSPDGAGGPSGSPALVGGGMSLADFGITLMDGDVLTFAGFGPRAGGQSLWAAIREQARVVVDDDGLTMPERGFDLWQSGGQLHVNAFERGGFTLGEGLALLHPNEAVLNPSSQMLQPLAEAIVGELRRVSGSGGGGIDGDLVVNISTGDSPLGMSTYRQPLSYVRHTNVAARR